MGKLIIHRFDPTIYPRKIYIVKGKNLRVQIEDAFRAPDGDNIITDGSDRCKAGVWDVRLSEDDSLGVLIWLRESVDVSVIAHESVHAANLIFNACGVDYSTTHDEHFAYLVGFIADCMWQVLTGKFKD